MASSASLAGVQVLDPPVKAPATPAVRRDGHLRAWLEANIEKGKRKVFTERMTVTPQLAQMMLERNKDNRRIYPAKLQQLKSDLNGGRWQLNGQTIGFAKTGELNDGQHRLTAVVETNRPADMLIAFGLERDSRFTVDTGKARSAGDHLALSGWPYATTIAAVSRILLGYEKNNGAMIGRVNDISAAAVQERANRDKLLQETASYAGQYCTKFAKLAPAKMVGLAFYLASAVRPNEAKTFFDKLKDGTDLAATSPIHMAREYLMMRPRLGPNDRLEILLRAWNAWITDKPVKQFKVMVKLPPVEG